MSGLTSDPPPAPESLPTFIATSFPVGTDIPISCRCWPIPASCPQGWTRCWNACGNLPPRHRKPEHTMAVSKLSVSAPRHLNQLYLSREESLARVEQTFGVTLPTREDWLQIEGPEAGVQYGKNFFELLDTGRTQGIKLNQSDF